MADRAPRPGAASRWGDLGRRALSAIVLAPIVLLCIWYGGLAYVALIAIATVGLAAEWARLSGAGVLTMAGAALLATILVAGALTVAGQPVIGVVALLAGFAALRWGARRTMLAFGVLYVGLASVSLLWLRAGVSVSGRADVIFLVLVVWASDIGAYMTGRLLRGPKLAPSLSPAKTWSGAIGGLCAAVAVAEIAGRAPLIATALLAILLAMVCQIGDLLESAVKRHVGVKDSGQLIPGHGGLLDRLDGLLAASPVAALVVLAGRGSVF